MHNDAELQAFKANLLEAVRDMKAGRAEREQRIELSDVAQARLQSGLTQAQFAKLMGVSVRTLQEWEQGRRSPTGAAKTLLRVAQNHPEVLLEIASD
ncbi:MAG: helix-turn-helix domain-containing protein [Macromonas sp.]